MVVVHVFLLTGKQKKLHLSLAGNGQCIIHIQYWVNMNAFEFYFLLH